MDRSQALALGGFEYGEGNVHVGSREGFDACQRAVRGNPIRLVPGTRFITLVGGSVPKMVDYEPSAYIRGLIWNCTSGICPNPGGSRQNLPEGVIPKCVTCLEPMTLATLRTK